MLLLKRFNLSWHKALEIDTRALAALRVGLGLLCLFWAWSYRAPWTEFMDHRQPSTLPANTVLMAMVFAGMGLVLGWHTRVATGLAWLCIIKFLEQGPFLMDGADHTLRLLLFWSLFLPLGAKWSLDARRNNVRQTDSVTRPPDTFRGWGVLALRLQVCWIYWMGVLWKCGPTWWDNGNAIEIALRMEAFATPLGHWLLQFPQLLRFGTSMVVWVEIVVPLLAILPFVPARLRAFCALTMMAFHLVVLAPAMKLGFFPWACATAWCAFLPASFWNWVERRWRKQPGPISDEPIMLKAHLIPNIMAILCWDWVMLWTASDFGLPNAPNFFPPVIEKPGIYLRLFQNWALFAPDPAYTELMLTAWGKKADGTVIPIYGVPPRSIRDEYADFRWRSLVRQTMEHKQGKWRDELARWLGWRAKDEGIVEMKLVMKTYFTNVPPQAPQEKDWGWIPMTKALGQMPKAK